jgi:sugar phosphate permease
MRQPRIFYGWWLSGLAGMVMVISAVPVFHGMAVWSVALRDHYGWSATQLGVALSLTRAEGAMFGPIEGWTADKFGTRIMTGVGLLVLFGAFVLFSFMQDFSIGSYLHVDALLVFYVAFMLMSLGQGLGGWVPLMTMLNHWFSRYRGTAMGISMATMTAGALVVVPALAWAVDPEAQRLGWRNTALIISFVILGGAILLPLMIRNRPQDMGLLADGDLPDSQQQVRREPTPEEQAASKPAGPELTVGQALRTQAFWCIAFGHGFASMIILAIMSQLGLMMTEIGYSLQTVAWIVALYNLVSLPFQFGGGYLGDRIPTNVALFVFTAIQGAAVVLITINTSIYMFYVFAILFGIGFGGRTPLTTAIRGEYFGRASFGKILGISTVPMNILLLISAPLAGYMRDQLGDYQWAFLTLAILNGVGALLFLIARRPRLPSTQPAPAPVAAPSAGDS